MTTVSGYTFPSPLEGWRDKVDLSDEKAADGKSYVNKQTGEKSEAYSKFVAPIQNGSRGGFDVHIYYFQENKEQAKFASELWQRIRTEFPELRIYRLWDKPVGPHPTAMFEVDLMNPTEFGAFVPWLVINRGPLSVLVHPNTDDPRRDHTQRATWLGERMPLDMSLFDRMEEMQALREGSKADEDKMNGQ